MAAEFHSLSASRRDGRWASGMAVLLIAENILFGLNGTVLAAAATLAHFLIFIAVFARSGTGSGGRRGLGRTLLRLAIPMTLFVALLALCVASILPPRPGLALGWAIDRQSTLVETVKLAGFGCLFLIGVEIGRRRPSRRAFMAALQGLAMLFAVYALVQFMVWPDAWAAEGRYAVAGRLTANFGSANTTAALLGALLILGLPSLLSRLSAVAGAPPMTALLQAFNLRTASSLALVGALMLTQSRAAIAVTAALVLGFVLWDRVIRRGRLGAAVAVLVAGVAIAALLGGDLVIGRFAQSPADLQARVVMASTHAGAVQARPWLGYGLGSFDAVNGRLITPENYAFLFNIGAAHNLYVQWLEGAGGVGAALMFGTVASLLSALAVFLFRRDGGQRQRIAGAVLFASLLFVMHGAVDYDLEVPSIAATWSVVLGVGVGAVVAGAPQRRRRSGARSRGSAHDPVEALDHDDLDAG